MTRALAGLILVLLLPYPGQAQVQRTFEQADVYPTDPGTRESGGFLPGGRFECRGATLLKLIATAYNVKTDAIAGPAWLGVERFDVMAKAQSAQAPTESLRAMLQALLADRFALALHEEQKAMPVYVLAVGK